MCLFVINPVAAHDLTLLGVQASVNTVMTNLDIKYLWTDTD